MTTPLPPLPRPARTTPTRLLALAAAILVVVGLGVGIFTRHSNTPSPIATAQLASLDAPSGAWGVARVVLAGGADQMSLATTDLPRPGADEFYEVWLFQPRNGKMLPLGVLGPSGRGQYSVAPGIMSEYSSIDVSLQHDNGDPRHSTVSALRGAVHPT